MKENFIDKVFNEDCLQGLKSLPDNSVDCCVTSPPYYALRDYGTGHWEGGDINCPHYRANKITQSCSTGHKGMGNKGQAIGDAIYKSVCPICGAVRIDEQIGLEETPEEYIKKLTEVFMEVHRILKPCGTLWLNIGDSYNGYKGNANSKHNDSEFAGGHGGRPTRDSWYGLEDKNLKPKDLIGIPWMLAFSLRNAGWYLRQDIIWAKPNPMPESVKDRCTKSHEYIFLLSKSEKYYFDNHAIQEKSKYAGDNRGSRGDTRRGTSMNSVSGVTGEYRNKRDVWQVNTKPDSVAHFATYPEELVMPCILAGCPVEGIVLDPFMGSGTTARVARKLNRHFVGFELNSEYCKIIEKKIHVSGDLFYC